MTDTKRVSRLQTKKEVVTETGTVLSSIYVVEQRCRGTKGTFVWTSVGYPKTLTANLRCEAYSLMKEHYKKAKVEAEALKFKCGRNEFRVALYKRAEKV